jgi:GMP synthase (glutamine-hydrolysing)
MIKNSTQELENYKSLPFVESAEKLRLHDYTNMNQLLFSFLDQITSTPAQ